MMVMIYEDDDDDDGDDDDDDDDDIDEDDEDDDDDDDDADDDDDSMMMNMMSTTADPRKGSEMGTLAPHLTYGIIPTAKGIWRQLSSPTPIHPAHNPCDHAWMRAMKKMESIRVTLQDLIDKMGDVQAEGESVGSYTQEFLVCTLQMPRIYTPSFRNCFAWFGDQSIKTKMSCDAMFRSI